MPTKRKDENAMTVQGLHKSIGQFKESTYTVIGTAYSGGKGIRIDLHRKFEILQRVETGTPAQLGFGAPGMRIFSVACVVPMEYADKYGVSLKKGDEIAVRGHLHDIDRITLTVDEITMVRRSLIMPGSKFDALVDGMFPNSHDFMVNRLALPSTSIELANGVNEVATASLLDKAETKRLKVEVIEELIRQGWVKRAKAAKKLLRVAFDDLSLKAQGDVVKYYKQIGIRTDKLESRIRGRGGSG